MNLGCNKGGKSMNANHEASESISVLGKELGLAFPPSTRIVGVRRESGIDDMVQAKLEIGKEEFPGFFAKTPIDRSAMRPGTGGFLGSDVDFWDPHKSPALKTGQAQRAGQRALNIGVDESRAVAVVVYVMQYGT
jgi:hypothetical protein